MKTNKLFCVLGILVFLLLFANLAVGIISVLQSSSHISYIRGVMEKEREKEGKKEQDREELASQRQKDILIKLSDVSSLIDKLGTQSKDAQSAILSVIEQSAAKTAQNSSENQTRLAILDKENSDNKAQIASVEAKTTFLTQEVAKRFNRSFDPVTLYERTKTAVADIRYAGRTVGTGFFYKETQNQVIKVVTAFHVVKDEPPDSTFMIKTFDGKLIPAKIDKINKAQDLAVLRPQEPLSDVSTLSLVDPATLRVGQEVLIAGNLLQFGRSTTTGKISALNRESGDRFVFACRTCTKLIELDAAVAPGYSGAPVVDRDGLVIGSVTSRYAEGNFSFAVSAEHIQALLSRQD